MEIKPSKVKNGKVTEMKCRFVLLRSVCTNMLCVVTLVLCD